MSDRLLVLVAMAFVCGFAWISGCATKQVSTPTKQDDRPRFLALGDSYTIGEGVAPDSRWPIQLAHLLRNDGVVIADPEIIARTGWTTADLSNALERENPPAHFALVSLLIGVNNQYRGMELTSYRSDFASLLKRAINLSSGNANRVLVLSIPDWGVTPFAARFDRALIAKEINQFNAVNEEETKKLGAAYVDITPRSRIAASDRKWIAADGLHPSAKMYAEWAQAAFPSAKAMLTDTTALEK